VQPAVLVHLSDIHFTAKDNGLSERNRGLRADLMRDLTRMRQQLGPATAIVVTGDIAYSGTAAQYEQAKEWLDEVARLVEAEHILTVPGNHDVDWSKIPPAARIARERLRSCDVAEITPLLDELLEDATRPLLNPLDPYNEFALRYRCEVASDGRPWAADLPLRGGYQLVLHGLTTVFNSDGNDGDTSLVVGKTQTVLRHDDPAAVPVVLCHHGPDDCRDRVDIRDRLRNKAKVLLCGHKHEQRIRPMDGYVEVVAGAVHPEEQHGWYPTYNWIRLDVEHQDAATPQLAVEIYQRTFMPVWNEFRSGTGSDLPDRHMVGLEPLPAQTMASSGALAPAPVVPSAPAGGAGPWDEADEQVPAEDVRPPLIDEEGHVHVDRRLTRDLLDLPVPDQRRVLEAAGLLTDADRGKDHVTLILDALDRVRDDQARQALRDLIAKASRAAQGRTA
jgi:predicted MPP superfamily phosphohydrolase